MSEIGLEIPFENSINMYKAAQCWKLARFVKSLSEKNSEQFVMAKIWDIFYFCNRFLTTPVNCSKGNVLTF
jgi:hypothetical protein